ncbi:MAG: isochorismatase family cysteine hydrolase [Lachnospiraceae bacterium]|nr:isochorismatase family cysteine hydrolase [Lachnospiraceae bacterium]
MKRKDLLLVIDMQNVYRPGEEWQCPSMLRAAENIRGLLETGIIEQTVFTRFTAPEHPAGAWRQYNEEYAEINGNRYLNEIIKELQPYTSKYPVYDKNVYSSFKIPELVQLASRAEHILLGGVVAECCVLATLMEAIDLGCKVIYLTDCISGQTEQNEQSIRKIAESFSPMHTLVMDSKQYIRYGGAHMTE